MKRPAPAAVVSTGSINDGVIRLDDKVTAAVELKTVRNGGVILTVEPASEDALRLVKMRKYYRAVVLVRLAKRIPTTPAILHSILSAHFLGQYVAIVSDATDETFSYVAYPSTTELNPEQFWAFVQQARGFALEHYHLSIPDPDPAWRLHTEAA